MWEGNFRHVSSDDEFIVYPLMDKDCNSRSLVKLTGETGVPSSDNDDIFLFEKSKD